MEKLKIETKYIKDLKDDEALQLSYSAKVIAENVMKDITSQIDQLDIAKEIRYLVLTATVGSMAKSVDVHTKKSGLPLTPIVKDESVVKELKETIDKQVELIKAQEILIEKQEKLIGTLEEIIEKAGLSLPDELIIMLYGAVKMEERQKNNKEKEDKRRKAGFG